MTRTDAIGLAARIGLWGSLAAIGFVTLSPIDLRPQVAGLQTEHVAAFGVVGLLAGTAYPRRALPALALVIVAAAGLELAQHLVPGRHGRMIDFAFKAIGGTAGFVVARIASRRLLRLADRSVSPPMPSPSPYPGRGR